MRFKRMISCIDAHTAGEPVRIVTSGFPAIHGKTMLERRAYVLENLDHCRKMIMREPRGHNEMFGAVIMNPVTPDGDIGVLFIDNGGMGTMCGHATIGVSKTVFETGMIPAVEGVNTLKIDTPAGRVTSFVEVRDGEVTSVSFQNVPAFLYKSGITVPLKGVGEVTTDVCFGGAFYAIVESTQVGLDVVPDNAYKLRDICMEVIKTLDGMKIISHPTEAIDWVFGAAIYTPPEIKGDQIVNRNILVFGDAQIDRSPCGTCTCARMSQLYAKGIMKPGMILENHSIIDTVFEGRIAEETKVADYPAIVPQISGMAYIMGINQLVLEPDDPMLEGFRL